MTDCSPVAATNSPPRLAYWIDGVRRQPISKAMTKAWEAMDRAYYHSHSNQDLMDNTAALIKALNDVRLQVRLNTRNRDV